MRGLVIISLCICLCSWSCKKEISLVAPIEDATRQLDILWKTPIVPDTNANYSISFTPMVHEDIVIFNSEYKIEGIQSPILALDSASGKIVNSWNNYLTGPANYTLQEARLEGSQLLLGTLNSTDCIDLRDWSTSWQNTYRFESPLLCVDNGYVYRGIEYGPKNKCSAIIRSKVNNMQWETIYSFCDTSDFTPAFESISVDIAPNGDTLVFWKNRTYATGLRYRSEVFAFNLNCDSLLWRNMEIKEPDGVIPCRLMDTLLYGAYRNHIFAIGLNSSRIIWSRQLSKLPYRNASTWVIGDIYPTKEAVICRSDGDETVAFHPLTGVSIWRKGMAGPMRGEFVEFEGKLFFISDRPRVIDIKTGASLLGSKRTEHLQDLKEGVALDTIRRVMYFQDGRFAYCVKIPNDL